MHTRLLLLLAFPAFGFPALAADNAGVQDAFDRINHCIQQGQDCHGYITTGSLPLYNRLNVDGLMPCVPKDATYISQEPAGDEFIVRAGTVASGKQRVMRLHFVQEQGAWKLDIPASLQAGIGHGWQQKVDMTEQVYLSLRQMGGKIDCSMLQNMIRK